MRVGFVGLGAMGAPMARRIAAAGWPLTVFARRPETLERLAAPGATVAPSLRELGAASDLVAICVVDGPQVEDVLLAENLLAGLEPGALVAVHSTVHPAICRGLAARTAEKGVTLIDAPVSGGAPAAAAGQLSVMAGGDPASFEAARPVFESFAREARLLGPVGSGQLAKAVNNLVFIASLGFAAEALRLGESLGLEPTRLAEAMGAGSGGSFALDLYAPKLSLAPFQAVEGLLRKDLDILLDVARSSGLEGTLLAAAAEHTLRMISTTRGG